MTWVIHYHIKMYCFLNDKDIGTRQRKLEKARNEYQLEQKCFSLTEDQQNQVNLVNVPPMLRNVPMKEKRSWISKNFGKYGN